ncbi:MAG: S9 family peptidase [Hyphomicrobiaceae bacterium]
MATKPLTDAAGAPTRPVAAKHPAKMHRHGIDLTDDYAWMKAGNWQEALDDADLLPAEIADHLAEENAYTEAMMADTETLQRTLVEELRARATDEDATAPEVDGPWQYYSRLGADGELPLLCRRPAGGGSETVLLDCETEAGSQQYWSLEDAAHSPDHKILAYAFDPKGSERCTIRFRNLTTGKDLPDRIAGTASDLVWSPDSRCLFYVRLDADNRPLIACRHVLGSRAQDDLVLYHERDPAYDVSLAECQSGEILLIESQGHDTNEVRFVDAGAARPDPHVIAARTPGHDYSVDHCGDRFVITTNSGGAIDGRICEAPIASPGMEHWRELVPHRPGRIITDVACFDDHLAWLEREDGLSRIIVRRVSDGAEHAISCPEPACHLELRSAPDSARPLLRFVCSSMTTPAETFDYDMETRQRTLVKTDASPETWPSGHDPARYETRRIHAIAPDGEKVPITLLHAKGLLLDGSAPLVLEGYGSYGEGLEPEFDADRFALVDRGFVWALAQVRGGDEKGRAWYMAGRHVNRPNTFTDYLAVARHLAAERYTREGRIIALGDSAGGMLIAAAINMAPELFLGAVADVPFVDVLNTMLDAKLPMTPGEWPEWGNPIGSKEDFALIRSYCPYQNIKRQPYPHVLALANTADMRVGFWEPAKWVARLREHSTSDKMILLHVGTDGGHDGASGRSGQSDETALIYAFAIKIAGIDFGEPARS